MKSIINRIFTIGIMALLTTLVGCSSGTAEKHYFQLESHLQNQRSQTLNSAHGFIWIESIDVASFLNKQGIVLQTDNIQFVTASNNLWGSSLSQQLGDRLEQDLAIFLPHYLVSTKAITTPTMTVKLFIDGFHGSYTGDAIIKGRWVVKDSKDNIETKFFEHRIALKNNGYAALVNALSKGWQDEERDFSTLITR